MHDQSFDPTSIPSMGTHQVGATLRDLAAHVASDHAIVEVGTWLGGGTAWLAQGAQQTTPPPAVHTYDQFRARPDEVRKALGSNVDMKIGADTLPLVQDMLAPMSDMITFHKGDLLASHWDSGPIGLYVDDAAKTPTLFYHVLKTFAPYWVPGKTVLVLLDYGFWESVPSPRAKHRFRVQQRIVEQNPACFEEILSDVFAPLKMAAFRYMAPLPMTRIRRQAGLRRLLNKLPG